MTAGIREVTILKVSSGPTPYSLLIDKATVYYHADILKTQQKEK